MTPRNRSQDLTADLLHDLVAEESAPAAPPPSSARAATTPTPFVETALYLSPRAWRRPGMRRSGLSVAISAGPVRVRIGRGPS